MEGINITPPYELKTIDTNRDFKVCQLLRSISYKASYGTLDGFGKDYGAGYKDRLNMRIANLPEGNLHLWVNGKIIGQLELKNINEPTIGYINLVSILPEVQRLGWGQVLIERAVRVFKIKGKKHLQLSVTNSNIQASDFYQKLGWYLLGPRPDRFATTLMQYDM